MTRGLQAITSYRDCAAAPVLLIAAPTAGADALAAIELTGARLLERIDWHGLADGLGRHAARPVLMIEAEGVADMVLSAALPRIDAQASALDLAVIISLAADQIDLVSAQVLGRGAQLLCAPTIADRIVALTVVTRAIDTMLLHDTWRESETARLRRLHQEVARIAEILTDLGRDGQPLVTSTDIEDRRRGYDAGPAAGEVAAQDVRQAIRARRLRDQFFGEGLFEDPAWDMLLDLFAAEMEGARVSVSSLCIAAAVAPTTALRWIAKLTDSGMLVRHPDPVDRRRAFMALAPQTSEAMRGYMLAIKRAELKIA